VPAAGLAKVNFDTNTFSTNLNDLTTGPLKIDTAAGTSTITSSPTISHRWPSRDDLGVSITSPTFINVSCPEHRIGDPTPAAPSCALSSPARRRCMSTRSITSRTPAEAIRCRGSWRGAERGHLGDAGLDHRAFAVGPFGSRFGSHQLPEHHQQRLEHRRPLQSGSCDPLAPPKHSTYTFVNNIESAKLYRNELHAGNRNVALMKLTSTMKRTSTSAGLPWMSAELFPRLERFGLRSDRVKIYSNDPFVRTSRATWASTTSSWIGDHAVRQRPYHTGRQRTGGAAGIMSHQHHAGGRSTWPPTSASRHRQRRLRLERAHQGRLHDRRAHTGRRHPLGRSANFPVQTGANIVGATIDTRRSPSRICCPPTSCRRRTTSRGQAERQSQATTPSSGRP